MRTITAVSVGRSDWGIYRPVLKAIRDAHDLNLRVIVSGAHTIAGATSQAVIERDGFVIDERIDMLIANDTPGAVAASMGLGTIGFAKSFESSRPDILLVLGDRFEMHAAALAAVPFQIPIAHLHGGELTYGAIDEAFRHAITKYASLHFASTQEHADRIVQLGEEPWRVTVSGAPALDNLHDIELASREQLEQHLSLKLSDRPLLVTFHPVTREYESSGDQTEALLTALDTFDGPVVITHPNVDTGNRAVFERLQKYASNRESCVLVEQLGTQRYFSLLKLAAAMVGNSSSGIIEAASFGLPVVNIGIRQEGRPRSSNIIDVACNRDDIAAAIRTACSDTFRIKAANAGNIYGDGQASRKIVDVLRSTPIDDRLIIKRFHDLPKENTLAAAA